MPDARKENEARAKLSQLQRSLAREEMKTKQGGGARGSGVAAVREMRPKEVTFVASWGNASHLRRKAKGSLMRDNAIATPLPSSSSLVVDIACGETGAVAIDVDGNAIVHSDGKATRIKNVRVSRAAIGAKSVYLVSEKKLYELDANALGKRRVVNLWQKEVALVCCGANHCLVATRCGALFAWGEAKAGQLGLGDGVKKRVNKPSLVKIGTQEEDDSLTKVSNGSQSISCGPHHSAAVTLDGSLWTWGWSEHGRLGRPACREKSCLVDNDQSHVDEDEDEDGCASTSPQKVLVDFLDEKGSTTRFRSVACGSCHTLAQTADGEVFGCGWNEYGQACGRMSPSSEPQHMSCNVSRLTRVYFDKCRRSQSMDGSPVRTVAIAAGFAHSLALDANGSAWAWGFGEDGQLGGGSERSSYEPIEVVGTSDRRRQHEGDDDGRPAFVFAAIAAYGCHSVAVATTCEDPTSLGRVIEERRRSTTARADAIVRIQACVRRAAIRSLQRKQIAKDARLRAATREAITSGRSTPVLRELSDYALIWSDGTAMKIAIEVTRRLEAHQALAASVFAAVAAIERESSLSRRIERYDAAIASVLAVPDKDVDAAAVLSEERVPWQDHFRPLAQALDARNRAREESQLHAALKITKCERGRQSRKGTRVVIDAGCRIASFAKRVVLVRSACASLQALKRRKKLEGESAGRISSFMKISCRNLRRRAAEEKAALMIQSVARRRVASKKRKLLERKYRRRRGEEARRQQQLQQEKEQARTLKMKKLFEERKRRAILDAREAREAARNAAMYLSGLRKKEARIAAAASEAAAKVLLRTKRDRLRDRRAQASADRAHLARHKNRAETFFPRITTATKNRIVPEVDEEKGPEDDDRFLAFGDDSEAALKKVRAASIIDRRKP